MKFIIAAVIGTLLSIIVCCSTKSNEISYPDFEPLNPSSLAVQDSTVGFYKNQCKKLFGFCNGDKRQVALMSRGFVFDISVNDAVILFSSRKRDDHHWWINGKGQILSDRFIFDYVVQSPDENT